MTAHRGGPPAHLCGTLPALVTPFNADGSIDRGALAALVQWHLQSGVQGVVPCGTTGEAGALDPTERQEVIRCVAQQVPSGFCVMAGVGSFSTAETLRLQQQARDAGATCVLAVTPPYARPSPAGLLAHYRALAAADVLPIVLYNVPSRTGCDLQPALLGELSALPQIVGIKEASGDLDRLAAIRAVAPHLAILSGDDSTACAFNLMGGDGVISVVANLMPQAMVAMITAARRGEVAKARAMHEQLRPLFAALFIESNPVPVKAALARAARMGDTVRLPLAPLTAQHAAQLAATLATVSAP